MEVGENLCTDEMRRENPKIPHGIAIMVVSLKSRLSFVPIRQKLSNDSFFTFFNFVYKGLGDADKL